MLYIIYYIYKEFLRNISTLAGTLPYLYFTFCTLVSITNITFLLDRISNVVRVQMFTNNHLCSIHFWNEEIRIILI